MVKPSAVKAKLADMSLATQLIRSAPHVGVPALLKIVQSWKDAQISDLNSGMQTLALVPKDIKTELQVGRRCMGSTFCWSLMMFRLWAVQSMTSVVTK